MKNEAVPHLIGHTLIVYPDGTDKPGVEFRCHTGFVSRIVSAVADQNIPDAELVAKILNAHFVAEETGERADDLAKLAGEMRASLKAMGDVYTDMLFNVPGERAEKAFKECERLLALTETDFKCSVCGTETASAPNWPSRTVCPEHCPDHLYDYERGEGHRCRNCGQEPPHDYFED